MKNRAQSAVEFVMTYGIALVIIFGAITAMHSLGVVDFDFFYTERCFLSQHIICEDAKVTVSGVFTVSLQNALGNDITNVRFVVNSTKCMGNANVSAIAKNQRNILEIHCNALFSEKEKVKGTLEVTYKNERIQEEYKKIGYFSLRAEEEST